MDVPTQSRCSSSSSSAVTRPSGSVPGSLSRCASMVKAVADGLNRARPESSPIHSTPRASACRALTFTVPSLGAPAARKRAPNCSTRPDSGSRRSSPVAVPIHILPEASSANANVESSLSELGAAGMRRNPCDVPCARSSSQIPAARVAIQSRCRWSTYNARILSSGLSSARPALVTGRRNRPDAGSRQTSPPLSVPTKRRPDVSRASAAIQLSGSAPLSPRAWMK